MIDDSGKVKIYQGVTYMLQCLPMTSLDRLNDFVLSLN